MKTLCHTPAKLILTGEHAVLFGAPALSMAIDLPTQCHMTFTPHTSPQDQTCLEIELSDFNQKLKYPLSAWQERVIQIETRYALYEKHALSIQSVLQQPVDLILLTLQQFHNTYRLRPGHWQIKIQSHPLSGKGLGSSASVIISILQSLFFQHELPLTEVELLSMAQQVESHQHGSSSGLDPTTVLKGGLLRYQQGSPLQQLQSQNFHGWIIDTGAPESTTGQAVNQVHRAFNHQHAIWIEFKKVAHLIEQAWQTSDAEQLRDAIKHNQQLLETIGVVPPTVQRFIHTLNQSSESAAKLCGAGSVSGEKAGIVLCISQHPPETLCQEYGYEYYPLKFSEKGSQCEMDL
ncbi:hypothetical protein P8629_04730 [Hydrogenovibrio sp. 3SP14C1]|uniref:mevalonate kinase family protein n=1 Tax=Hydrogenovibrio sp. 3SP14C1 TaxID=3038774 RepID=UPI0024178257|nr:hypothetical protein [Hydrogenovibrio sp. 3SP14C1]MDG4812303.1 hypothetical protein [Hydrogenovibrio sp. 3SP14C1]